ncbi:MAG: hypothetical protein JO316_00020 [Abitibacteriaceae bacterium]|nr:hypothetical protein [Abditibacteriaceae bacterium]MBV9863711.1 hypothetical protein [Abditibacteriaceae bacterium]
MSSIKNIQYYSELSGSADDSIDLAVELTDGRIFLFVAITPQHILTMMATNYKDDLEWVEQGMLIVRRIDEECINAALEKCLSYGIELFGVEQKEYE